MRCGPHTVNSACGCSSSTRARGPTSNSPSGSCCRLVAYTILTRPAARGGIGSGTRLHSSGPLTIITWSLRADRDACSSRRVNPNQGGLLQARDEQCAARRLAQVVEPLNIGGRFQEIVVNFVNQGLLKLAHPRQEMCETRVQRVAEHDDIGAGDLRRVARPWSVRSKSIRPARCRRCNGVATPMMVPGKKPGSMASTRGRASLMPLVPWNRDVLHKSRSAAPDWQGARSAQIENL